MDAKGNGLLPPRGLETNNVKNNDAKGLGQEESLSAAKSDAFLTKNPEIEPDLAKIMEAWPTLPGHIRKAILALVETSK